MISGRGRNKIRPPRRNILGSHGDAGFDDLWAILENALREIHTKNASKLSFEQLYRAAYKIVLKKQGDELYDKVRQFEEQWFNEAVMPPIRALISQNLIAASAQEASVGATIIERRLMGEKFLKGLKDSYGNHHTCMNMTTDVLMYMDRVYCTDNRRPSIFTTAMGLYRDHVLRSKLVQGSENLVTFDIIVPVILDQIHMEREGDIIDKNLIRSCIYMLEGLYETDEEKENEKLYLTVFEPHFLAKSSEFYAEECDRLLRDADASSWLRQTQKRLVEEADRCRTTISLLTDQKIMHVVEQQLISRHLQEFVSLVGTGVKAMIDNDRYDDLKLVYQNVSRIDDKKEALKEALSDRVIAHGSDINSTILATNFAELPNGTETGEKVKSVPMTASAQATAAAIKWVEDVLALKDKFDTMWKTCFEEDITVQGTLTNSFSEFINAFSRGSEYVSLFIDEHLKRGIKGKTEAEVDAVLDKATTLLRYLADKDMFERYYKKHLARRLLHGRSESSDVEKQMISRMKLEIGSYFTNKLEGMFKDMTLSEELSAGYRNYVQSLGAHDTKHVDLGVNVLTSNYWPMESMGGGRTEDGTRATIEWPSEVKSLQESFRKYYLKDRTGRQLTWLGFMGSADLRCIFPRVPGKEGLLGKERRHEITVTTYGMVVLLLFNDLGPEDTLSLEEIEQTTRIPHGDLVRLLTTLAILPKAKVLNKVPANKSVQPGDRFSFNASFSSKSIKIKAPTIAGGAGANKVEGEAERKDTEDRNDEMRGGVVEACIVRIMKQRKELLHQSLVAEVITQLSSRFRPDINMVKKRIESLIEREYLERVEDAERPTYRYLA